MSGAFLGVPFEWTADFIERYARPMIQRAYSDGFIAGRKQGLKNCETIADMLAQQPQTKRAAQLEARMKNYLKLQREPPGIGEGEGG